MTDIISKHAKNLKKHLPDFIKKHGVGPYSLSQMQELAAVVHGFPSFHAASRIKLVSTEAKLFQDVPVRSIPDYDASLVKLRSWHSSDDREGAVFEFPSMNEVGVFDIRDRHADWLNSAEEDELPPLMYRKVAAEFWSDYARFPGDMNLYNNALYVEMKAGNLQEATLSYANAIESLDDIIRKAGCTLVSYYNLSNRGYHALNQGYVSVLMEQGLWAQATGVCNKMLKLHKNDNIGFRFLKEEIESKRGA